MHYLHGPDMARLSHQAALWLALLLPEYLRSESLNKARLQACMHVVAETRDSGCPALYMPTYPPLPAPRVPEVRASRRCRGEVGIRDA